MVRYKYRYIVAEIQVHDRPSHAPYAVSKNRLQSSILNKVGQLHGDFGVASAGIGFRIKYCNPYTKIVLIKCQHGPHRFVTTSLPLVNIIDDVKVQFRILYVGGTMMKSFKFIRNYQLSTLEHYWNKMKSDSDRTQMKKALEALNV